MRFRLTITLCLLCLTVSSLCAQEAAPTKVALRGYHGWGRFPAGSWRLVRATKEKLDENGNVTDVTTQESKSTLTMVSDKDFELTTETTLEVAGRKFAADPQKVRRDYFGMTNGTELKFVRETDLVVNGIKRKCRIYEALVLTNASRSVTQFYVPASGDPLIVKQTSVATSTGADKQLYKIDVDVMASEMPHRVVADLMPCAILRTVQQTPDKRTVTLEVYSQAVPGGVVHQTVKILDREGRVIERHTVELEDYGREEGPPSANNIRSRIQRRITSRRK